jgi:hypothetical protein
MGSSELRALGLGLEVSGALGLGTLMVGALQSVQDPPSIDQTHSGGRNLSIIGGVGAAALGFGILLHQGSRSSFQLSEIEDERPSASTAPVLDANGVGFRF